MYLKIIVPGDSQDIFKRFCQYFQNMKNAAQEILKMSPRIFGKFYQDNLKHTWKYNHQYSIIFFCTLPGTLLQELTHSCMLPRSITKFNLSRFPFLASQVTESAHARFRWYRLPSGPNEGESLREGVDRIDLCFSVSSGHFWVVSAVAAAVTYPALK